jgi:hypothetical protein
VFSNMESGRIKMQPPLGWTEKDIEHTKKLQRKDWKKFSAWRKGYKAGKKNLSKSENPYRKEIKEEVWEKLRKMIRWDIGWEDAVCAPSARRVRELKKRNLAIEKEREFHKKKDKVKKHKSKHHDKDKHKDEHQERHHKHKD